MAELATLTTRQQEIYDFIVCEQPASAGPLIDAALSVIDRGGQLDEARRLARRRLPALTRVAPAKAAARLRDYLLRRGFPGGVVAQVLRESLSLPVD